ncbi:unnamed protein product [Microthlaspi erraticum]|uniref:Reverse transcriptase domain-containing protein n=1 Tax=Microthlaspi erraticum TaxID=1685480 RepID=A0A6D2HNI5_9BRAS|nr:unnamed protein product [Microthlaspi erraticum]
MQIVSPQGFSGGLVVLWKDHVSVSVVSFDSRLVDLSVEYKAFRFYLSCIYGHPMPHLRHCLWKKLQRISVSRQGPWMMCGDFNEILNQSEKRGGRVRAASSFRDFNQMMTICDMTDIKHKGNRFSWVENTRNGIVECCLDRVMANSEWRSLFPASETKFLDMAESDHRPMIEYKLFHGVTKIRKPKTCIKRIIDEEGITHTKDEAIAKVAEDYFVKMFTASDTIPVDDVIPTMERKVTDEMNTQLTQPVTDTEIKEAMFLIGSDRAPGHDGFSASFYRQFWNQIGPDVCLMVRNFFVTGTLEPRMNHTQICLIPKITDADQMKDYRPISLCTVNYKIISKILVLRLKKILDIVISDTQAAFVPGRQITDNIMVAHEIMHALKSKKDCAAKYIAIKTDISKAYDRVEWDFLEAVMMKMGFSAKWTSWIMACVRSASLSVLINGSDYGFIQPSRGIRQGDPLSPYLFLFCAETLSQMLVQAKVKKEFKGMKITKHSPSISHLLFADDSLFFCEATNEDCSRIARVLKDYEAISGQMVNLQKSSIIFGMKISHTRKILIQSILGIRNIGGGGKYLGLPEQFGRSKTEAFQGLVDGVKKTVNGWVNQVLSTAGKEVLIKSCGTGETAKVYRGRYQKSSTFLESVCGVNPSYGWRSIQAGKDLLRKGLQVRIGDGKSTSVWEDHWLPVLPPRLATRRISQSQMKVEHLWKPDLTEWEDTMLASVLTLPGDMALAKTIKLSRYASHDEYYWAYNTDRVYTVKSGYWVATHVRQYQERSPLENDYAQERCANISTFDAANVELEDNMRRMLSILDSSQLPNEANPMEQDDRNVHRSPSSQWEPPPIDFLKCNFDSSYCRDLDYMRVGWIVWDSNGAYLDAGWPKLNRVGSALEAEATGFLYVVQRMWSKGWRQIWFESDNQELTRIINKQQHHVELGNLIFDIRHWIQKLSLCSLDHVNREKNQAVVLEICP